MFQIAGDIVTPDGVLRGGVVAVDDDGRIASAAASSRSLGRRSGDIDAAGLLVLPGFVDLHVHGGGGADFMHGTEEAVRQAARTHARYGTTTLLATTLTAPAERIEAAITSAGTVMRRPGPNEARVAGVHLEGPYICRDKRGAQPEGFIRDPDVDEMDRWIALGDGAIRQITLAPERPGAEALIRRAASAGVVASVGHTDATAAQVQDAAAWGARQATHVFNAMRGIHHREPGVAGAVLALDEYTVEVIADGVHLDPMIVRLAANAKGPDRVVLITDAIEGAAMPDGTYRLGDNEVIVRDGVASFADGTLAGSVLTMNRAFVNARRFAGVSESVAARMSAGSAARQIGRADIGSLEPNKRADIVVMDPGTGDVWWTIIDGRVAYKR
jgi:N-acetylglucosamine-6-phosphate deacetylase